MAPLPWSWHPALLRSHGMFTDWEKGLEQIYIGSTMQDAAPAVSCTGEEVLGSSRWAVPEARMSRGPFELVLLPEVHSEVVAPCEALVTHVALVAGLGVTLRDTQ